MRSSVCNLSEFSPFISYEDFTLALQRVFCEMHSSPNLSCTVVGDSLLERNVTVRDHYHYLRVSYRDFLPRASQFSKRLDFKKKTG